MKFYPFAVLLGGLTSISFGQEGPAVPGASISLETLASRSGTREVWAEEVGRLDSGKNSAAFTVLAIEDPTRTGQQIRGLRLALSVPEGTRTLHIAEAMLQPLKEKLDGLAMAARAWSGRDHGYGMISTVCPGEEVRLPLSFGYHYRHGAKPELSLGGPDLPELVFPGPTLSQLLDIFGKAIQTLRLR